LALFRGFKGLKRLPAPTSFFKLAVFLFERFEVRGVQKHPQKSMPKTCHKTIEKNYIWTKNNHKKGSDVQRTTRRRCVFNGLFAFWAHHAEKHQKNAIETLRTNDIRKNRNSTGGWVVGGCGIFQNM
jgi:hypothetical protein